jgi:hypothetical protein
MLSGERRRMWRQISLRLTAMAWPVRSVTQPPSGFPHRRRNAPGGKHTDGCEQSNTFLNSSSPTRDDHQCPRWDAGRMRARSSHRSRTSARPHAWVVKRSRSGKRQGSFLPALPRDLPWYQKSDRPRGLSSASGAPMPTIHVAQSDMGVRLINSLVGMFSSRTADSPAPASTPQPAVPQLARKKRNIRNYTRKHA